MGYLIRVPIDDDGSTGHLVVEASEPASSDGTGERMGIGDPLRDAGQSLEKSLSDVEPALRKVMERLRAIAPGGLTVEFGLMMGAEAGVVLAKGSTQAHFAVTACWQPCPGQPAESRASSGVVSYSEPGTDAGLAGSGAGDATPPNRLRSATPTT